MLPGCLLRVLGGVEIGYADIRDFKGLSLDSNKAGFAWSQK